MISPKSIRDLTEVFGGDFVAEVGKQALALGAATRLQRIRVRVGVSWMLWLSCIAATWLVFLGRLHWAFGLFWFVSVLIDTLSWRIALSDAAVSTRDAKVKSQ